MKEKNPVGRVIAGHGSARFTVQMEDGTELIAYVAGKLRKRRIYINIGDRVEVKLDEAGGNATNRIVWRK